MTNQDQSHTHFFLITMSQVNATGPYANTLTGTLTLKPGATRLELFNEIRAEFEQRDPKVRDGIVLAFDIQPNQL